MARRSKKKRKKEVTPTTATALAEAPKKGKKKKGKSKLSATPKNAKAFFAQSMKTLPEPVDRFVPWDELVIDPAKYNPRTTQHSAELGNQIRAVGILNKPLGFENEDGAVVIFAGFGRCAFAQKQKREGVNVRVWPTKLNKLQMRMLQMMEQSPERSNWSDLDTMTVVADAVTEALKKGFNEEEAVEHFGRFAAGMQSSGRAKLLWELSKQPQEVHDLVRANKISPHAASVLWESDIDEEDFDALLEQMRAGKAGTKRAAQAALNKIIEEAQAEEEDEEVNLAPMQDADEEEEDEDEDVPVTKPSKKSKKKKAKKQVAKKPEKEEDYEEVEEKLDRQSAVPPDKDEIEAILNLYSNAIAEMFTAGLDEIDDDTEVYVGLGDDAVPHTFREVVRCMSAMEWVKWGTLKPAGFESKLEQTGRKLLHAARIMTRVAWSIILQRSDEKARKPKYEIEGDLGRLVEIAKESKGEATPWVEMGEWVLEYVNEKRFLKGGKAKKQDESKPATKKTKKTSSKKEEQVAVKPPTKKEIEVLTVKDMQEFLDMVGVEYPKRAKKVDLTKLIAKEIKKNEAAVEVLREHIDESAV